MAMNQFLLPDLLAQLAMPAAHGREGQAGDPAPGGAAFDTVIGTLSLSGDPALPPAPVTTAAGRFGAISALLRTDQTLQWQLHMQATPAIASPPRPDAAQGDSARPEGRDTGTALPPRALLSEKSAALAPRGQEKDTPPDAAAGPVKIAPLPPAKPALPVPAQSSPPCAPCAPRHDVARVSDGAEADSTAPPADLPQIAVAPPTAALPASWTQTAEQAGAAIAPTSAPRTTQAPPEPRRDGRPSSAQILRESAATASSPPPPHREVLTEALAGTAATPATPAAPPSPLALGQTVHRASAPISEGAPAADLPAPPAGPQGAAAVPETAPGRLGTPARRLAATAQAGPPAAAPSAGRRAEDVPPPPPARTSAAGQDSGTHEGEGAKAEPTRTEGRRRSEERPRPAKTDAAQPAPGETTSGDVTPVLHAAAPEPAADVVAAGRPATAGRITAATHPPRAPDPAAPGRRPTLPDWSGPPSTSTRRATAPTPHPAGVSRLAEGALAAPPPAPHLMATSATTPTTADDAARRHAAREENQPDARVTAAAPSASGAAAPQPLASAVDARFAQREEPPDSVAPQPLPPPPVPAAANPAGKVPAPEAEDHSATEPTSAVPRSAALPSSGGAAAAPQMLPAPGGAVASEPAPTTMTDLHIRPQHEARPASAPVATRPTADDRAEPGGGAPVPPTTTAPEATDATSAAGMRDRTARPPGAAASAHVRGDAAIFTDHAAPEADAPPARAAAAPAAGSATETASTSASPPASPAPARRGETGVDPSARAHKEAAPSPRTTPPQTAGAASALPPPPHTELLQMPPQTDAGAGAAIDFPADIPATPDHGPGGVGAPSPHSERPPARSSGPAPAMMLPPGPADTAPATGTAPRVEATTVALASGPPPASLPPTDGASARAPDRHSTDADSPPATPRAAIWAERPQAAPAASFVAGATTTFGVPEDAITAPPTGPAQAIAPHVSAPAAAIPLRTDAKTRPPPTGTDGDEAGSLAPLGPAPPATAADAGPATTPASAGRDIAGHVPAHHVLRQLHEAVARAPDGPVEVALSPEELGRVRMTLHPVEHGITVTVQAERPETLDLMRRNIEMLARDFRALGYADVSFSFGAESGERQGGEATPPPFVAETESASPAPPIAPPTPAARGADGSLDLRM